jgi:hypothetical protein
LLRIFREAVFLDNIVVKMVPQKLGARASSMPIVDSKERAFWPFFEFPVVRLYNV